MKKHFIALLFVVTILSCSITAVSAAPNWVTMSETPTITYQIDKETMNFSGSEMDRQLDVWMRMVLKDKDGMSIVGHYLVKENDLSFMLKERLMYSASGAPFGSTDSSASGWVASTGKSPIGSIAKRLFVEYRQKSLAISSSRSVEDIKLYENKPYHFTIKYPSHWMLKEGLNGSAVSIISPVAGSGTSPGFLMVTVKDIPPSISFSLDKFEEISLDHEEKWEDYKLIKHGDFKITGVPAKIHIFTEKIKTRPVKVMEVDAIANNKIYMFQFIIYEMNYNQYEEAVLEMMKSIAISTAVNV